MPEDDIVELLWQNGQIVRRSQTQRPTHPPILRGGGSGGGGGGEEENAPFTHQQSSYQNIFSQEDEIASWLQHQNFCSHLLYSTLASTLSTQPQIPLSLSPPPLSSLYDPPSERLTAARCPENFMNFSRLRGNIFMGGRVEAGPSIRVVRETMQVISSATSSSSATESYQTPATHGAESRPMFIGGVSHTSTVHGLGRKEKAVAIETVCEIAGISSSLDSKAKTEPIQIQPTTETEIADDSNRKEREKTMDEIKETREARGSVARKMSRAAEMHNLSERRRKEKINEKMKALQELIPRCNKSDKASLLDDAIEYTKALRKQIKIILMRGGRMPMMYPANMQRFKPHMTMGMNQAHTVDLGPSNPVPHYPIPNVQASDPSRVRLLSPQPTPVPNQPQFPAYINPYRQFVGLHQMQQPLLQLSFSQASSSKKPEDQHNQTTG